MDHLPYPQHAASLHLEIQYACAHLEEYDGLDFINYPVRRGWAQVSSPQSSLDGRLSLENCCKTGSELALFRSSARNDWPHLQERILYSTKF